MGHGVLSRTPILIPRMAQAAIRTLIGSLEAFKNRDADRARAVCDEDDEVDALYDQVYRDC
jgi:phosphate uptake regulator